MTVERLLYPDPLLMMYDEALFHATVEEGFSFDADRVALQPGAHGKGDHENAKDAQEVQPQHQRAKGKAHRHQVHH